jgi:hypothetical protein
MVLELGLNSVTVVSPQTQIQCTVGVLLLHHHISLAAATEDVNQHGDGADGTHATHNFSPVHPKSTPKYTFLNTHFSTGQATVCNNWKTL